MKFGTSIMIFFLAIVALVAEFIMYLIFGLGTVFSGDLTTLSGTVFFFVSLMVLTAATGVLAPICALIELIVRKKNIGVYTMVSILGLILIGLVIFSTTGIKTVTETELPRESKLSKASTEKQIKISKQDQEKMDYYDKVVIRNVYVGKSILDETGVFGEIKNLGNKSLKEVEITIYCLDKDGRPIFEKKYYPILVSEWSFEDNGPLKPNYSKKFGVKLDDAPSDWAKKVEVKVTDIEFLKNAKE